MSQTKTDGATLDQLKQMVFALQEQNGELLEALEFIAADIAEGVKDKAAWQRIAEAAIAKAVSTMNRQGQKAQEARARDAAPDLLEPSLLDCAG